MGFHGTFFLNTRVSQVQDHKSVVCADGAILLSCNVSNIFDLFLVRTWLGVPVLHCGYLRLDPEMSSTRRQRGKKEGTFLEHVKECLQQLSAEMADMKSLHTELKIQQTVKEEKKKREENSKDVKLLKGQMNKIQSVFENL